MLSRTQLPMCCMAWAKLHALGMNALCTDVQINAVETGWGNCWSSDGGGQLGALLQESCSGADCLDGCMMYTHTQGIRDQVADFSGGILSINKAAGFITRLIGGQPRVAGPDNLSGKRTVDVGGWAPTSDAVAFVENKCLSASYAADYNMLVAPANGDGVYSNPNDIAVKMALNDTADVMYVYADQANNYKNACHSGDVAGKDCGLWSGFGTTFGYIGTGNYGYMVNGTTLILSRKGSGVTEQVEPCLQSFMATQAYYGICVKYGFVDYCFPNAFFPTSSSETVSPYNMRTSLHSTSCADGYCGCDAPAAGTSDDSPEACISALDFRTSKRGGQSRISAAATFATSTVPAAAVAGIAAA